jgi:hypothetical protein
MEKRGKTEKISVTLPRELAGEIKSLVSQGEVSSFFAKALEHYLAFRKQRIALDKGFGIWGRELHPDLVTAGDARAYVRSLRKTDRERLVRLGDSRGG